ncbi:MAG: chemotaxis protein CheW [Betaproteobacteria bacterium]
MNTSQLQQATPTRAQTADSGTSIDPVAREYLAFKLGGEEYGVDLLQVQEIRGYGRPTRMAQAPAHIKGVINLRGVIVPIVDLRIKFDLPCANYDEFTVVIILNVGRCVMGAVVDAVSDVISLTPAQVRDVPDFPGTTNSDYIQGLGSLGERTVILLDIEKFMGSADMGLNSAASTAAIEAAIETAAVATETDATETATA